MKDKKEVSGRFHKLIRTGEGNFGIETVVLDKGKVVEVEEIEANYPTIALAKYGKTAFAEAMAQYDKDSQVRHAGN